MEVDKKKRWVFFLGKLSLLQAFFASRQQTWTEWQTSPCLIVQFDSKTESCNHGTVEVEEDLWRSSHPTSLPLQQVAQEHVQVFEYLWGWRLHNHPRQSVTALSHHQVQKAFPDVQGNLLCLSLYPLPVPGHHWIVSWLHPLCTITPGIYTHWRDPPPQDLLSPGWTAPSNLRLGRCSSPFISLAALWWTLSSVPAFILYWEAQTWTQYSSLGSPE